MIKKLLFIICMIIAYPFSTASAEKFLIEADGYHTVSRKETIEFAEDAAVDNALKWAVEQIGVRISAYSEVVNKVLVEDTVQRFASSVIQIKEKTLTPRIMNDDYRIYAHVVCVVDTADLDKWEPPDVERQRRLEEDKARLEEQNQKLREEKDASDRKFQKVVEEVVQNEGGTPGWDYLASGDKAYLNGDVETAQQEWIKAWKKGNISRGSYGVPEKACHRLAIVSWNKGIYNGFVNWLFAAKEASFEHRGTLMFNELYSHWIYPDTTKPMHNKKINLKQLIKDKKYNVCLSGTGWEKYFK